MRIFLTIEFVALLILCIVWGWEYSFRSNFHSKNGGWTTTYNYNARTRKIANIITYLSGGLSIIGVLVLIWTF